MPFLVPQAPRNPSAATIAVTTLSPTSVQIALTQAASEPVFGVAFYALQQLTGSVWKTIQSPLPAQFPVTVNGLTAQLQYSFRVLAFGAGQTADGSQPSNISTVTMPAATGGGGLTPAPDTTPPTVPGQPVLDAVTSTTATISWPASSDQVVVGQITSGLAGYLVFSGSTQLTASIIAGTTYTVTGLTPNTQYSLTIKAQDNAGNISHASSSLIFSTSAAMTTGGGTTLMQQIQAWIANGTRIAGQTLNLYSGNPLGASGINANAANWTQAASLGVGIGAGQAPSGLVPGIIDLFCDANPGGADEVNDFVSLANGAPPQCIIKINYNPPNPSGGSVAGPFPASVLTTGSAANVAYLNYLKSDIAKFKQITRPILFCYCGEMNLGGFWNDIQSGATSAQFAQLWQLTIDTMIAEGYTNFLAVFETNTGVGQYAWGYPGAGYVDLHSCDSIPPDTSSIGVGTALRALNAAGGSKPCFLGSSGSSFNTDQAPFSNNTYTAMCQVVDANVANGNFPPIWAAVVWTQNDAMCQQNGAVAALSTAPWINSSSMPIITVAGGNAQG